MSGTNSCCPKGGSAIVIVLLVLLAAAAGALAYVSLKTDTFKSVKSEKVSSSDSSVLMDANINPVLASFDGEEITRQEVIDLVNTMPPQMQQIPMEQLFPMALEQMINNKVIDKKASGSNLDNDKQVKEQLALVKDQIIRARFIELEVEKQLTEERINTAYQELLKEHKEVEEVKASHILVDDEKLVKSILKKLGKGGDFAALAKEYSKDGSAEKGGELGYFIKTDVVPEFGKAAFDTKVGAYTKKAVKSQFGYHIIKIEEKRVRKAPELTEVRQFLEQELRRTILEEVIKALRDDVNIVRFDINGNPLVSEENVAEEGKSSEAAPEEKASE